jgi:hypothetical protein
MRGGEDASPANATHAADVKAREEAWKKLKEVIGKWGSRARSFSLLHIHLEFDLHRLGREAQAVIARLVRRADYQFLRSRTTGCGLHRQE